MDLLKFFPGRPYCPVDNFPAGNEKDAGKNDFTAPYESRQKIRPPGGRLPEGYRIESVEVDPDMLQVFMPENGAKKEGAASVLRTTPIYLHGLLADMVVYCKIVAPADV
jgi:hypothetical protein